LKTKEREIGTKNKMEQQQNLFDIFKTHK